jgi:hypothetical protein
MANYVWLFVTVGNGLLDLVVGHCGGPSYGHETIIFLYRNTGTSTFPSFVLASDNENPFFNVVGAGGTSIPYFADLTGDGHADIMVGGGTGIISYYIDTALDTSGVGTFVRVEGDNDPFMNVAGESGSMPSFVNFRGKPGVVDFVGQYSEARVSEITNSILVLLWFIVQGYGSGYTHLDYYLNIASPEKPANLVLAPAAKNPLSNITFKGSDLLMPTFVDMNSDGLLDAVLAYGGSWFFYKNAGTASQPIFVLVTGADNPMQGIPPLAGCVFVDLQNLGRKDLVLGNMAGNLLYFQNTGTATAPKFEAVSGANNPFFGIKALPGTIFSGTTFCSDPAFVSLPGSSPGLLDLVLGNRLGTLQYYKNVGSTKAPKFEAVLDFNQNPFRTVQVNYGQGGSVPVFVDVASLFGTDMVAQWFLPDTGPALVIGSESGTISAWVHYNTSGICHLPCGGVQSLTSSSRGSCPFSILSVSMCSCSEKFAIDKTSGLCNRCSAGRYPAPDQISAYDVTGCTTCPAGFACRDGHNVPCPQVQIDTSQQQLVRMYTTHLLEFTYINTLK